MYFSPRTRNSIYWRHCSTNMTSSDRLFLQNGAMGQGGNGYVMRQGIGTGWHRIAFAVDLARSEERRVGKECRSTWWTDGYNKLHQDRRRWLPARSLSEGRDEQLLKEA